MDFDGSRYYKINRMMLSSIGLWPYQNVWLIRIQRVFCLVCLISFTTFQLSTFTTFENNLKIFFTVMSYTIPCLIVILKYVTYCIKTESMRKLLEIIKYDWNTLKSGMEYDIINKYTYVGAFYAQLFALVAYTFPAFFAFMHLLPKLLDFVAPLNQSRPQQLAIVTEYFIDNEKYFHLIFLHMFVCIVILQTTLSSTSSIYIAYIQHVCGLFEIASYRIERALDENKQDNLISGQCCTACSKIIAAIDIHRRAIGFFEFMKDTFIIMYFLLLVLGVLSLTIYLCNITIAEDIAEMVLPVFGVGIHLFYFFFLNYLGQKVLDHSNNFLMKTYNSKWHITPLHVQKLILFIMQKSSKNCMLLLGGIYIVSLEGFATAMSTSVSYFMVIYSIQ